MIKIQRRTSLIIILIIIFTLVLIRGLKTRNDLKPTTQTKFMLGTLITLKVYDSNPDSIIFTKSFNRIKEIEELMSQHDNSTLNEVVQLNNSAGRDYVKISPDTTYVLEKSNYYAELSQGNFDITIGPIVALWNIDTTNPKIPDKQLIQQKLPLVNYQNLELDKNNLLAKLKIEDMSIDLGAIAKGYAADEVGKIFKNAGIEHAIINIGGNILTIGNNPSGDLWNIGIQAPFKPRGDYMGTIKLQDQAFVSSGIYEKYFEVNDEIYHHLIDPHTGYPVKNNLESISIITNHSIDADALSTCVFLLGLDDGMRLVEQLDQVDGIFITNDKKVYLSSGITNFQITNEEFSLQTWASGDAIDV